MDNQDWIKELINTIDKKVDNIDKKLDLIQDRHVKNTEVLSEHIYRTELNEEQIAILRDEVKPVKKHVDRVEFIFKIIGFASTIISLVYGVIKISTIF